MSVHYRAAHSLRPNARNVAAGTYCCTCCTYYKGVAAKPLGQRRSSSHGQTYQTTRTIRYAGRLSEFRALPLPSKLQRGRRNVDSKRRLTRASTAARIGRFTSETFDDGEFRGTAE